MMLKLLTDHRVVYLYRIKTYKLNEFKKGTLPLGINLGISKNI